MLQGWLGAQSLYLWGRWNTLGVKVWETSGTSLPLGYLVGLLSTGADNIFLRMRWIANLPWQKLVMLTFVSTDKMNYEIFIPSLWMVANGKCETARLAFFFASPRHFDFLDCETETSKCLTPSYKKRDCETHITAQKTRLRDPWNSTKILRDPEVLKNHSTPLRCESNKKWINK